MGALTRMRWRLLMCMMALSLSGCFNERGLFLVAEEFVPVYETVEGSLVNYPMKSVAGLEPRQKARVLKRVDVKHYQIYKVELSGGKIGYVNEGKYKLLRKNNSF